MSLNQVVEKFANQTTMHGVPKIIHSKTTMARCFWAVVCFAAGSMFCMQLSEVLQRYFSYPKKVTVEVVPTPVPFPSISICNMRNLDFHILNTINSKFLEDPKPINHINNSESAFVNEYMKTIAKYSPLWYHYQRYYPLVFQEVFSRTTFSANIPQDIISEAAVQLNEFVVNCFFGGNHCNMEEEFTQFFDQYYYNCFTYTAAESNIENQDSTMSLAEGIENGWSSIVLTGSGMLTHNDDIRILPGLHQTKSAVSGSEGVRVVIHPPGTEPFPFTEGYDVPPGFSASFGIRPRRNFRMGPPHGNCTRKHKFIRDDQRYRSISCQKMCLQEQVVKSCECYESSLPQLINNTANRYMPCRNDEFSDECMFNGTEECLETLLRLNDRIQCARKTRDKITRETSVMEDCQCFPPCDEVFYDVSYSLSKWPAAGYEGDAAFFDVFYIETFRDRFKNTPKYPLVDDFFNDTKRSQAMSQFARLNVYVADSNVIKTQETADYQPNQLVSDIGGQLGLWVGISVITLTEVMELFISLFRYFCSGKMAMAQPQIHIPQSNTNKPRNGVYKQPSGQEYFDPYYEPNKYSNSTDTQDRNSFLTYTDSSLVDHS